MRIISMNILNYKGIFHLISIILMLVVKGVDSSTYYNNTTVRAYARRGALSDGQFLKIGTQVWMSKNLDVCVFNNGDSIPEARTNYQWIEALRNGKPAWCYYNNDPLNNKKYGKLYNQYAIHDSRGLAPKGWRIPNDKDWKALINHYGVNLSKQFNCTSEWESTLKNNTHENFLALPGGYRFNEGFDKIKEAGFFWSDSKNNSGQPSYMTLIFKISVVFLSNGTKSNGYSVRCLK